MSKLRIVFMGTPDFAAEILKAVAAWNRGEVVAVYTQPDRPAGRGKKLTPSATKKQAEVLGIPVFQPVNFRDDTDVNALATWKPDVLVVAAYGLILPQRVLDIPSMGAYNVHASLLPQYRGAAPIQRAIMNGDNISGITIMKMEAGLDSGPILLQQAVSIDPADTAGTLFDTLAAYGSKVMVGALGMIAEGRAAFVRQNENLASYAAKITAAEEYIDWSLDARSIHNIIRGLTPFPGAKSILRRKGAEDIALRLVPGQIGDCESDSAVPGTILRMDGNALLVACGKGTYRITHLRPAGKSTMSAADFRNGRLRGCAEPYGILTDKESRTA